MDVPQMSVVPEILVVTSDSPAESPGEEAAMSLCAMDTLSIPGRYSRQDSYRQVPRIQTAHSTLTNEGVTLTRKAMSAFPVISRRITRNKVNKKAVFISGRGKEHSPQALCVVPLCQFRCRRHEVQESPKLESQRPGNC
ncbi:hypothetical protein J6590_044614 [Homalodisca vitripennis]|nr:hypothetical protein J6590_044614 [Homalodisca vitripennis]